MLEKYSDKNKYKKIKHVKHNGVTLIKTTVDSHNKFSDINYSVTWQ